MRLKRNTTLTGRVNACQNPWWRQWWWWSHSTCDEAPLSLPTWRGTFIAFSKYCEPEISCHLRGQDTGPGLAISAAGAPTWTSDQLRSHHHHLRWERWARAFTVAIAGPRRKYIVQNVFPSSLIILFFCVLNSLWHKAGMRIVLWSDWPPIERPIVRVYL